MWIVYAFLSAGFAAAVAILGKIGLKNLDSTLATTIRAIVMAAFLVIISISLSKFDLLKSFSNRALIFVAFSGIAGALSWLFYFWALKFGPATAVAAIDRLSVVFVVVLSALFLGEALTLKSVAGAALIVAGAVLLVLK